jgi:predicted  nucleic acid-binding Zn-ribbon protein
MDDPWCDRCRSEYGKARNALEAEQREHQRTATDLVATRYTVELQKDKIDQLQRQLAASEQRALTAIRELAECKRQGEAGGTRLNMATPMLPPSKSESDT